MVHDICVLGIHIKHQTMRLPPYRIPVQYITPALKEKILSIISASFHKNVDLDDYDEVVVAQQHAQIVGVVCVSQDNNTDWVMLQNLCVAPASRRRGIASDILEFCRDEVHTNQTQALHVNTGEAHTRLMEFYLKRGFKEAYTNRAESLLLLHRNNV